MRRTATVSVILVNFNQSRFVTEAWLSVKSQTVLPNQLVVVDDGSSGNDVEVIKELIAKEKDLTTVFIQSKENLGISARLNQALEKIESDWLIVLAADDALLSNAIEDLLEATDSSVDVVWGDLGVMNESGELLGFARPRDTWQGGISKKYLIPGNPFNDLLKFNNFIPGGMTLIRTQTVINTGGWDSKITTEDFDLWLRISKHGGFKYLRKEVGKYRIVEGSKSRRDTHKLLDQARFLGKHSGESKDIDKGLAYLAAMRWAFTAMRGRRLPDVSINEMSNIIGIPPKLAWLQMPRAIANPVLLSLVARIRRLTNSR